jgi:hypothetical protein
LDWLRLAAQYSRTATVIDEPAEQAPLGNEASQARAAFEQALERMTQLADSDLPGLLGSGVLDRLLRLMVPHRDKDHVDGEFVYDFMLRHKNGLQLLALVRRAITNNYSFEGTVQGHRVYVSPNEKQWFPDGLMFLQGEERFSGLIGLYRDGRVMFAIAARDTREGEMLGPNDFLFVDVDEAARSALDRPPPEPKHLELALSELAGLLERREENESQYQDFLKRYPWAFGGQYSSVTSHEKFDDRNIPDFTGMRVSDGARDIIEIKNPFLRLFRADGEFSAEFHGAWQQAERYLDFAERESDYLARRGLRFENPRCYLFLGKDLSEQQLQKLRAKERRSLGITLWTYDDLERVVKNTVKLVRNLSASTVAPEA